MLSVSEIIFLSLPTDWANDRTFVEVEVLFVELVPVTLPLYFIESNTFIIFVAFLVKHNHGDTIVGRIYHEISIQKQSIGEDTVTAAYTGFS